MRLACWPRRRAETIFAERENHGLGSAARESPRLRDAIANTRDACATRKSALHCCVFLTHLECTACGVRHEWSRLQNVCTACGKPLFAIVDLAAVRQLDGFSQSSLRAREKSLWRYREVLSLPRDAEQVSLGEGDTPLLRAKRFCEGVDLWIKDESQNP